MRVNDAEDQNAGHVSSFLSSTPTLIKLCTLKSVRVYMGETQGKDLFFCRSFKPETRRRGVVEHNPKTQEQVNCIDLQLFTQDGLNSCSTHVPFKAKKKKKKGYTQFSNVFFLDERWR